MYLSWWTPRQCCLCFSRQASRSRCLSPLWSAGLPIIRWRGWWCRRWWPPPNRLCLAPSLLSQKSTDFPLFRWQTEKVWQRLTHCAVRTDKLRQFLISTYGTEKVWQRLTVLLYGLINLDKHWRLCCTYWLSLTSADGLLRLTPFFKQEMHLIIILRIINNKTQQIKSVLNVLLIWFWFQKRYSIRLLLNSKNITFICWKKNLL